MKRAYIWAVATMVAAGLLTACSGGGSTSTDGKDGVITIGATFQAFDEFPQSIADAMKARAAELGASVNVVSADNSSEAQLSQVENFVNQRVAAIVVNPVDPTATEPITEAATSAGIPLVYVNERPDNLPDGVAYVGSDSYVAGELQMTRLAELAGHKGSVVILEGTSSERARQRTRACRDVVAKNPQMRIVRSGIADWSRDKALDTMENWLQSGEQIDVVCANNDEMALGAIQALTNAGLLDQVVVGGIDATADGLAAMRAGELEVTVLQDAVGQGSAAVETALKLARGEQVESSIDIPYVLVTPDTIGDLEKKQ